MTVKNIDNKLSKSYTITEFIDTVNKFLYDPNISTFNITPINIDTENKLVYLNISVSENLLKLVTNGYTKKILQETLLNTIRLLTMNILGVIKVNNSENKLRSLKVSSLERKNTLKVLTNIYENINIDQLNILSSIANPVDVNIKSNNLSIAVGEEFNIISALMPDVIDIFMNTYFKYIDTKAFSQLNKHVDIEFTTDNSDAMEFIVENININKIKNRFKQAIVDEEILKNAYEEDDVKIFLKTRMKYIILLGIEKMLIRYYGYHENKDENLYKFVNSKSDKDNRNKYRYAINGLIIVYLQDEINVQHVYNGGICQVVTSMYVTNMLKAYTNKPIKNFYELGTIYRKVLKDEVIKNSDIIKINPAFNGDTVNLLFTSFKVKNNPFMNLIFDNNYETRMNKTFKNKHEADLHLLKLNLAFDRFLQTTAKHNQNYDKHYDVIERVSDYTLNRDIVCLGDDLHDFIVAFLMKDVSIRGNLDYDEQMKLYHDNQDLFNKGCFEDMIISRDVVNHELFKHIVIKRLGFECDDTTVELDSYVNTFVSFNQFIGYFIKIEYTDYKVDVKRSINTYKDNQGDYHIEYKSNREMIKISLNEDVLDCIYSVISDYAHTLENECDLGQYSDLTYVLSTIGMTNLIANMILVDKFNIIAPKNVPLAIVALDEFNVKGGHALSGFYDENDIFVVVDPNYEFNTMNEGDNNLIYSSYMHKYYANIIYEEQNYLYHPNYVKIAKFVGGDNTMFDVLLYLLLFMVLVILVSVIVCLYNRLNRRVVNRKQT